MLVFLLFASVMALFSVKASSTNDRPIIGIFSQPTQQTQGDCGGDCLYIAASYVKEIEAAGGRVVPINYYATQDELDDLFSSLNGFLFPGGGAVYPSSAQYIFDRVKAANDKKDFMPLMGTCMGFQWLLIAQSRDTSVLDPSDGTQMDAYNLSIPLDLTQNAPKSKMFGNAPVEIMKIIGHENVTMNNHHYGIYSDHFHATDSLKSFYDVLSTNKDRQGAEFISTIEAFNYPIYGTQWHPEKNDFEWGTTDGIPNEAIDHSRDAVAVAQYIANFFVSQARHSTHAFTSYELEDASLISNYNPVKTTGSFQQTYFFKNGFKSLKTAD